MTESLSLKALAKDLKAAGAPWEMDESTEMALLTEDERRMRLGVIPPAGAMSFEQAVAADKAAPMVTADVIASETAAGLPTKFDHRDVGGKNYTTPPKNQGGCGSCVAHGVVAVMETTYRRSIASDSYNLDLSEAHLFYCHGGEEGRTCANGWFPDQALDKCKDKGVTLESVYPYTGNQQACAVPTGWEANVAKSLGKTKLTGRTKIKEWIATRGSVTGCFIVYQDFFSYRSGVYRHVSGEAAGGHCVEIIGYDDALGCWICKNSWGTNWGEGGYFKIAYGQAQIETWLGPYGSNGVTVKTWNNNLKVNGLWINESDRNAYVHFTGLGWKKLTTTSAVQQHAMLADLIGAKGGNRTVRALIDGSKVKEIYVI